MRAMVLAAGKGTRLGKLTESTPKCLVDVGGEPMLARVFSWLLQAGVTEVIVNLHYLSDQVRTWVAEKWMVPDLFATKGRTLRISFSDEAQLLGTGGGLLKVKDFFASESEFLVVNADIHCTFELQRLHRVLKIIRTDQAAGNNAKLLGALLTMQREESSYLLFGNGGRLLGFQGASGRQEIEVAVARDEPVAKKGFCGVQMLSSEIFKYMQGFPTEFSLIEVYMKALREGRELIEVDLGAAQWADIGTAQGLEGARSMVGSAD